MTLHRRFALVATTAAVSALTGLTGAGPAVAAPVSHGSPALAGPAPSRGHACPTASSSTGIPAATALLDWSENLGYDARGDLWVSRLERNLVQRYDRAGHLTGSVSVASPGAVRRGPDGLMYVASGDSPTAMLPGAHGGSVVRFDPGSPHPSAAVFATGFGMPNGAGFDAAGNLYVSDTASGVVRIRRDGTVDEAWSDAARQFSVNGLAVRGDDVYTTITYSGDLVRIPIAEPGQRTTVAHLTAGALPAIPDDMALGQDGTFYVASTSGHIFRIDTAGRVCDVLSVEPMTSLAFVPGSPSELVAGTETGAVLRIHLQH